MSERYEGSRMDLFDFPQVPDLEEFGLVPPVRGAEEAASQAAQAPAPAAAPENAEAATDAPVEGTPSDAADQGPRPAPPLPDGVTDLDEDLFGFDELFSLDDDPYFNGTLAADGSPANPIPQDEALTDALAEAIAADPQSPALDPVDVPKVEVEPTPITAAESAQSRAAQQEEPPAPKEAAPSPQASPAPAPEAASPAPAPAPTAADAQAPAAEAAPMPGPAPAPPAPDLFDHAAAAEPLHGAQGAGASHRPGTSLRDRGPRILLPEDVPYGGRPERTHLVWAVVACFLIMNGAVLYLAHRANASFQSTLSDATGVIAEALARDGGTSASVPILLSPGMSHTTERIGDGADSNAPAEPWIDPSNYANTHELAVENAKVLLQEGRYEEARRQLNYVLANQNRVPLSPALHEEIDYLIPLTYYEHGNATAVEDDE